jgi:translation initiation factor IF-3
MDFSKYKYEEARRQRAMHKHQHAQSIKEIKFHVTIADHDFEIKIAHIRNFLQDGHKVKLSLQFRGRESLHTELGFDVINRAIKKLEDFCIVEQPPKLMGRTISAMIAPRSNKPGKQTATVSSPPENNPGQQVPRSADSSPKQNN